MDDGVLEAVLGRGREDRAEAGMAGGPIPLDRDL